MDLHTSKSEEICNSRLEMLVADRNRSILVSCFFPVPKIQVWKKLEAEMAQDWKASMNGKIYKQQLIMAVVL